MTSSIATTPDDPGDVGIREKEETSLLASRKARLAFYMGPAFIAAIAYIDPGNFATNIQAGADYGYLLIWVIVASNLMAMVVQSMSAKLGIATGRNLPETIHDRYPKWVSRTLWVIAEVVAMATDLAEFLGAAVGLNLLFGIPLLPAGIITGIATFAILWFQKFGVRPLQAIIAVFLGVVGGCFLVELLLGKPSFGQAGEALLTPRFADTQSVLLATGILGATVMPHVIYLHSNLTQHHHDGDERKRKMAFRFEIVDILVAMSIAGLINAAMLMMAAATFWAKGYNVGDADDIINEAYKTLDPVLGASAGTIFAVALLASGLSSSAVGTMAGQVIMQGFIKRSIPITLRRLITMIPALVVIAIGVNATDTLVVSQVILSFGIPFALVPLVHFTNNRDIMGGLVNRRTTTILACAIATVIIALNLFLIYRTLFG